jgi:quercetin dioxygenase-like cupin family protein
VADAERAVATVHVDNDQVRVTQWSFARGATTGWHRHELPYVVVPLADGALALDARGETSTAELRAGQAYYRDAGVEHDVANATDGPFDFVEIELKPQT